MVSANFKIRIWKSQISTLFVIKIYSCFPETLLYSFQFSDTTVVGFINFKRVKLSLTFEQRMTRDYTKLFFYRAMIFDKYFYWKLIFILTVLFLNIELFYKYYRIYITIFYNCKDGELLTTF